MCHTIFRLLINTWSIANCHHNHHHIKNQLMYRPSNEYQHNNVIPHYLTPQSNALRNNTYTSRWSGDDSAHGPGRVHKRKAKKKKCARSILGKFIIIWILYRMEWPYRYTIITLCSLLTKPWEFSNYWTAKDRTIRLFWIIDKSYVNTLTRAHTHRMRDTHKQPNKHIRTHSQHNCSISIYMYKLLMVLSPNRTRLT